jgi:pre-mRNA-processing factor 39
MEFAFSIYKEALEIAAAEEKQLALPILYVHFSRLKFMVGSLCLSAINIRS